MRQKSTYIFERCNVECKKTPRIDNRSIKNGQYLRKTLYYPQDLIWYFARLLKTRRIIKRYYIK